MEVNKQTKLTLSLETIVSGVVTLAMIIGMWFTLQADIQLAKELPAPSVSRTEYPSFLNFRYLLLLIVISRP